MPMPMPRRLAALIATVLAAGLLPSIARAGYTATTLSEDGSRLTLTDSQGRRIEAPRLPDQVAFSTPRRSRDGRHVGWLAMFDNCCTSYPIALKLVVLDDAGRMRSFEGEQLAIFDWCFPPGRPSVAFRQGVLHGTDAQHFERRRIADARLLASYDYPHDEREHAAARRKAPAWVRCVPD